MELCHPNAAALLERAGEFLLRRATQHSILLATAERALDPSSLQPSFSTVEDSAGVILVASLTKGRDLVISAIRDDASVDAIQLVVADFLRRTEPVPGVFGPADSAIAFANDWACAASVTFRERLRIGAFELDRVVPPTWPAGEMRLATSEDIDLLATWAHAFIDEAKLPESDRALATPDALAKRVAMGTYYLWIADGVPVTMAAGGATSIPRIGPVYTPPSFRRHGYASALVARLSQHLLDRGATKVALSADVANPTSNKIYLALGYRRVGEDVMIAFESFTATRA
ncbi:GNAT family N-acetyltransferase [soil metagenome]